MSIEERYIELGLRVGRHIEGYVDAYYGPAELKERTDAEEPVDPAALAEAAAALIADVESAGFEPQRSHWLLAQTQALEAVSQRLAGEDMSYTESVRRCYGIVPRRPDEREFERAHELLDEALPGGGDLRTRFVAWRERSVPADRQLELVESISDDLRSRVREVFGLPEGEAVKYDVEQDKPWVGFNYFEGGRKSRVALNSDVPMPLADYVPVVAHESYPGHHTEHATKEAVLVDEGARLELAIILSGAPESVVSEGIAESGYKILLGDTHELARDHLARIGIEYDPETERAIVEAREALGEVSTGGALLLHEDGASEDEVKAYIRRWSLAPDDRVNQMFRFISDPMWGTYVPTYVEGERLCLAFVGDDPARFKRLLTEQLTPADLGA